MIWVDVQLHQHILLKWGLDEWQSHWYFDYSCLCVICAIHLRTSNRRCWGNATGVPKQKRFTSKATHCGWYYYSLAYFLTMPKYYQCSASFLYKAGTKHWITPDNKLATKICNKLELFTRLISTITGFTSLVSCIKMLCVKVQLH